MNSTELAGRVVGVLEGDWNGEGYEWVAQTKKGVIGAVHFLVLILWVLTADKDSDPNIDGRIVNAWAKKLAGATARRCATLDGRGPFRVVVPCDPVTLLELDVIPEDWSWVMAVSDADSFLESVGMGFRCSDILAYWRGDPSPYTTVEPATAQTGPVQRSESEQDMGSTALKKSALISMHRHEWPTIEADLREASRNGLGAARVKHGFWDESAALNWAKRNGKIRQGSPMNSPFQIRGV